MKQLFRLLIAFLLFTSCQNPDHSQRTDNRSTADDLKGKTFSMQISAQKSPAPKIDMVFNKDTTGAMHITEGASFVRQPFTWEVFQDSILQLHTKPVLAGKDAQVRVTQMTISYEGTGILCRVKNGDDMLLTEKRVEK